MSSLKVRLKMLEVHNKIQDVTNTFRTTNDIWLSDLWKLEELKSEIAKEFRFKAPKDSEGKVMLHYADWILKEKDDD